MIESSKMKLSVKSVFIATLLFYVSLLVLPNKPSLFLVSGMYFIVLWRMFSDFRKALMALYITLIPIIIGKLFVIDLIPARDLNIPTRQFGIAADVIVSVSDAVLMGMTVVLLAHGLRGGKAVYRNGWLEAALLLYPVTSVISTMLGSVRPEVSILHSAFTLRPLILYYFFATFAPIPVQMAFAIVAGSLFFETCIVVAQGIAGGSLGLVIEPIANFMVIDFSREAAGLLRYGGTFMHANALGNALLPLLFFLVPTAFYRFGALGRVFAGALLAGVFVLALTMSRSAWAGLAAGVLVCIWLTKYRWRLPMTLAYRLTRAERFMALVVVIGAVIIMVPRLVSTLSSTKEYGSIETRTLLIREYSDLIRGFPWFGVGLEMDVYTQYQRSLVRGDWDIDAPNRTAVLYFPEPVHNGMLRLLIEVGLVGALPYVVICVLLFMLVWRFARRARTIPVKFGAASLIVMYVAMFVNAQMQPIKPDLPILIVFTMLYLRNHT